MKKKEVRIPKCTQCKLEKRICMQEDGKGPVYCPTLSFGDVIKKSRLEYETPIIKKFALNASIQESECYVNRGEKNPHVRFAIKPRIQETIEFANKMGYKRLGIAFCTGLRSEARILSEIVEAHGFEVVSVVCKTGRTPKEALGLKEEQKINPGTFETMCSPITQAKILNALKTEFNIVFGLCVGHDSLFMRYSDALCTVLVAKDRVTGHNPLAAILLHKSYYKKLSEEKFKKGGFVSVSVKENK